MTERVDLFDNTYKHFTDQVLDAIRKDTFGIDIGQNSWVTVDEYERLLPWLILEPDDHVLEIATVNQPSIRSILNYKRLEICEVPKVLQIGVRREFSCS